MDTTFVVLVGLVFAGAVFYFYARGQEDKEKAAREAEAQRVAEERRLADEDARRIAQDAVRFRFEAVPFDPVRRAHHWLIGGSGHGKTQTIQHLVALDIPKILMGEMSVIVLDSQSQIIPKLAGLDVWKTNPDKLRYIDPAYNPPALNLFATGSKSGAELNSVLETYDFIINSLMAGFSSDNQELIFNMLMRLMMRIDGATIHMLIDLLSDTGIERYRDKIAKLPSTPRKFFETEYLKRGKGDPYRVTREAVSRRLWLAVNDDNFDSMFSQDHMGVDFMGDMDAGKLILIDTNKKFFHPKKSQLVGALFIGLVYQAIISRSEDSKPCIFIIDECHEYFRYNGHMIRRMLEQARKYNVGLVLAHQDLSQLNEVPGLMNGISANTAIKMAGGTSEEDARALSPILSALPEYICDKSEPGLFVTSIPSMYKNWRTFETDFGRIERLPRSPTKPPSPRKAPAQSQTAQDEHDNTKAAPY